MARKWVVRAAWAALGIVLALLIALMVWEPFAATRHDGPPAAPYSAEIIRDDYGVPHIYGRRDVDVAYGIARAHAEDDFFTLQDVLAMTRGRYGAIAGEDGAPVDYIYHLLGAREIAGHEIGNLPDDVHAILDAYASGLNDYAAAHPAELKLDRLFPVTAMDIATGFALRQPFFFQLDNVIGALAEGRELPEEHGPPIPQSELALPVPLGADGAELGSNAFAIAPEKSGDGVTRLVSNTHQPLRGGVAWYELVVESGEGWHFAGATFPGAPFPLLGHNEHLGWTNTVNRPDLIDVYELEMDESGRRYRLDGEWRELQRHTVTLPVRFGPLVLPVRREVLRSVHGPVLKNANGYFAIRYGGMDTIEQIGAYFRLNKARDYAEWRSILASRRIPSTNFIYADETGRIAFIYNAAIPARPTGADWRGVMPGNRSDLIWQNTVPLSALPQYENPASGWLFNSNNTPFSAAGEGSNLDPAGFAAELGIEMGMTNRAIRADKLLSEPGPISLERLKRIKFDTGWEREIYVAEVLDGIAALDLSGDPELQKAQKLLATWDMNSDGAGAADALALIVLRRPMWDDFNGGERPPPRELLEDASGHLLKHFGRLDVPMNQLLRLKQGKVDLPMDGGSDTLRAATAWDVMEDGRLSLRHGDSFLMFIEWPANGSVRSQSVQPFGSATTRPRSPHFTDQMEMYVRHALKPVHFNRTDVLENAIRRYRVASRDTGGHK
jgi:acyl-homoserine-lactone acylase